MPNTTSSQIGSEFDSRVFLGEPGAGRSVERYARNQRIFSQGDVADTVFYILKGKVKRYTKGVKTKVKHFVLEESDFESTDETANGWFTSKVRHHLFLHAQ